MSLELIIPPAFLSFIILSLLLLLVVHTRLLTRYLPSINYHNLYNSTFLQFVFNATNLYHKTRTFLGVTEPYAAVIEKLYVYPIKSVGSIEVTEWPMDEHGLRYDRQYAIGFFDDTKNQYKVITQRECPKLAAVKITYSMDDLTDATGHSTSRLQDYFDIHYMDNHSEKFRLPANATDYFLAQNCEPQERDTSLWNNDFKTLEFKQGMVPEKFLHWSGIARKYIKLSKVDGGKEGEGLSKIRLLYSRHGKFVKIGSPPELNTLRTSLFHDYYPLLILAQQDIDYINKQLALVSPKTLGHNQGKKEQTVATQTTALNFRGNVLVSTRSLHPFDIDTWQRFNIVQNASANLTFNTHRQLNNGSSSTKKKAFPKVKHQLKTATKCIRCSIPNIDIRTGTQRPSLPVSKLLNRHRKIDAGTQYATFGINAIHCSEGYYLRVGDEVEVIERKVNLFEPIS